MMRKFVYFASLVFFCATMMKESNALSLVQHIAQTDWNCVDFQVIGVCRRKTPPYVGIKVKYRQPVLLIETIPHAGDTAIDEFRPLVQSLLPKPNQILLKQRTGFDVPSQGSLGNHADTSSAMLNEVHVFSFPLTDIFSTLVVTPCEGALDLVGPFSYMSELDAWEWHIGDIERAVCPHPAISKTFLQGWVGEWGPLCPRTGWFAGSLSAVASALIAFRAVDISSIQLQSPHIIVSKILFIPNREKDRMQMVYPTTKKCMKIGEPYQNWQENTGSADGKYVWIYWREKECCLF